MSKVTTSGTPSFVGSNISVGGSSANSNFANGNLNATYNMSKDQEAIYNYAMNTLANILPTINTFDANTINSLQSQVDSLKSVGIGNINDLYNSNLQNLQSDTVSRFGNLDNSIFADNLNKLANERAKAVSSFAQDILSRQSELESNELNKRYNMINMLTGVSDNIYDTALKTIGIALNGSTNATNANTNLYRALINGQNSSYNTANRLLSNNLGVSNLFSFL